MGVYVCLCLCEYRCTCVYMHVHVHVEAGEQPLVSFLMHIHLFLLRQSLSLPWNLLSKQAASLVVSKDHPASASLVLALTSAGVILLLRLTSDTLLLSFLPKWWYFCHNFIIVYYRICYALLWVILKNDHSNLRRK